MPTAWRLLILISIGTAGASLVSCRPTILKASNSTRSSEVTPRASFFYIQLIQNLGLDSYLLSDSTNLEITGSAARLKSKDQIDSGQAKFSSASGANPLGVIFGTLSDGSSGLKLGSGGACDGTATNCAELSSSWTPQWGSLAHYWRLNGTGAVGGGSVVSASVGTSATALNANGLGMNYVSGKLRQGIAFDGVDDALEVDISPPTTNYSLSTWFKSTTATTAIFSARNTVNSIGSYDRVLFLNSGNVSFYTFNVSVISSSGRNFANGVWHQAVVTVQSGVGTKIYIDGSLVASGAKDESDFTSAIYLQLGYGGCVAAICGVGLGFFQGSLDEAALWNAVLTPQEIALIYSRQSARYAGVLESRVMDAGSVVPWTKLSWRPTLPFLKELPDVTDSGVRNETSGQYSSLLGGLMTGIVGLWHLNETAASTGVGNDFRDASGSGNSGEAIGGVTFNVSGQLGGAASFHGAPDAISVGDSPALRLGASSFSLSAWFRSSSTGTFQRLISKGHLGWNSGFLLATGIGGDGLSGSVGGGIGGQGTSSSLFFASTGTNFNDAQWHLATVVFDRGAGRASVFVDGVVQPVAIYPGTCGSVMGTYVDISSCTVLDASTADLLALGRAGGVNTEYFIGDLDEAGIWARALQSNEIRQLYQRGASRLKFQVRSCSDPVCAFESWLGPDGTSRTYFSELNNNTVAAGGGDVLLTTPSIAFSDLSGHLTNNRYFQYRAILESDSVDAALGPELKSTSVDPSHYDPSSPAVTSQTGVDFTELTTYSEVLGANGCGSGVVYNLSLSQTGPWKYWNGAAWATSDGTSGQASSVLEVNANAPSFGREIGTGKLYFNAFLRSSGTSACELESVRFGGLK